MKKFTDYFMADKKQKPQSWLPADGEPENETFACLYFLQLGSRRTYRAVARYYSLNPKTISRWSQKYHWLDRAYTYDKLMYRIAQQSDYFDFINFRDDVFHLKLSIARNCSGMMNSINSFMANVDVHFQNQNDKDKLEFCRKNLICLRHFYKIVDISPTKSYLKQRRKQIQATFQEEFGIENLEDIRHEIDTVMTQGRIDYSYPYECNGYAEDEPIIEDEDFNPEIDEIIEEPMDYSETEASKPIMELKEKEEEKDKIPDEKPARPHKTLHYRYPGGLPDEYYELIGKPHPDSPEAETFEENDINLDYISSPAECQANFGNMLNKLLKDKSISGNVESLLEIINKSETDSAPVVT